MVFDAIQTLFDAIQTLIRRYSTLFKRCSTLFKRYSTFFDAIQCHSNDIETLFDFIQPNSEATNCLIIKSTPLGALSAMGAVRHLSPSHCCTDVAQGQAHPEVGCGEGGGGSNQCSHTFTTPYSRQQPPCSRKLTM